MNQRKEIEARANEMGIFKEKISNSFPHYRGIVMGIFSLEAILKKLESNLEEYSNETSVNKIKENFTLAITDDRRGLATIQGESRANVRSIVADQLYSLTRGPQVFINNFLNMIIMGKSGVGKTLVATVLAFVFSTCGLLATDNVFIVTRADLIGQYIGQTAIKTRAQLFGALDGILFIDEAYQLVTKGIGTDFGPEAITEIVNFLDKYIGLSRVFAAGYEKEIIDNFLGSNEGMPRRFPYQILLADYSLDDLYKILIKNLNNRFPNMFTPDDVNFIFTLLKYLNDQNVFNNQAGDMTNLATFITVRVNSGKTPWGIDNHIKLLLAFNSFLESKGSTFRLQIQ